MQNSQLPVKWVKPFAVDDANKVELPVTTATLGRASQSLGFPPITMQPPESGGVPPQGEDFNGAMNQVARFVWWQMAGGALPFDTTWAANAAIGGYPQGARIAAGDLMGEWISTVDNNTVNPDTVGTGWVPGSGYGATALAGLTNANVTLTPAQAAKPIIRLSGTLTGNIQIIFPTWLSEWLVVNNTTGAFSVTAKTAAGSGVVVSQTGGQQTVWGDGTNLIALGGNSALPLVVGTPTLSTHAAQFGQTGGRLLRLLVYTRIAGVQNVSIDGAAPTTTGAGSYTPSANMAFVVADAQGGGGAGGGPALPTAGAVSIGAAGTSGAYGRSRYSAATIGASQTVTVGLGGAAVVNGTGGTGGASSVGALITAAGGTGAGVFNNQAPPTVAGNGNQVFATGANMLSTSGTGGTPAMIVSAAIGIGGNGGNTVFGPAIVGTFNGAGNAATNYGGGGGGVVINNGFGGNTAGGAGASGVVIIAEYA